MNLISTSEKSSANPSPDSLLRADILFLPQTFVWVACLVVCTLGFIFLLHDRRKRAVAVRYSHWNMIEWRSVCGNVVSIVVVSRRSGAWAFHGCPLYTGDGGVSILHRGPKCVSALEFCVIPVLNIAI